MKRRLANNISTNKTPGMVVMMKWGLNQWRRAVRLGSMGVRSSAVPEGYVVGLWLVCGRECGRSTQCQTAPTGETRQAFLQLRKLQSRTKWCTNTEDIDTVHRSLHSIASECKHRSRDWTWSVARLRMAFLLLAHYEAMEQTAASNPFTTPGIVPTFLQAGPGRWWDGLPVALTGQRLHSPLGTWHSKRAGSV